jgi:histidinol phosphatase-like PHP family hydrolase
MWMGLAMLTAAAAKNGVGIEINARCRIPSEKFFRKAKAAGVKFAFGTNNADKDLGDLAYSRLMAKRLGLTAEDMFTPKPDGRKAIHRRNKTGATPMRENHGQ